MVRLLDLNSDCLIADAATGLTPLPVMGTLKIVSLFGLVTVNVALRGDGHWAGGVPIAQVSCGANVIVTSQD